MSAAIATDLRRLAGQLLMTGIPGIELDAATAQWLQASGVRAVCLRAANLRDAAQLTRLSADLRRALGPQALIAIDPAGVSSAYPAWLPQPPGAMDLCALGDAELANGTGAATARGLRALGINWLLAPLINLDTGAAQAFGGDPAQAAAMAQAWTAGCQAEGVACCARLYLPRHGAGGQLRSVDKTRSQLEEHDFVPFRQAATRTASMMGAHVAYPALDASQPANLSPAVMHGLLRQQWSYGGVLLTPGIDAQGAHVGARALLAGADMALLADAAQLPAALDDVSAALASGALPLQAVGARLQRLAAMAARYPAASGVYAQEAADRIIMAEARRRCQ
ncbi:glycoside hydrolase family 3 N-terminal domain-containing protein [Janthinobacterium sp. UMAB-60]|uniref:glycoside hydrolase family 3 N-terminal domain-containing protein n=1 Tax=Janthinobacterium sp. UMAB-60 TaxID=1365365 RepID=UPI001C591401|nr:glycoside hydrolase family 3 N-terminal domain-containing protein [Janthinobacterium sp. UMAB-60]